jgi:hypothetical protein
VVLVGLAEGLALVEMRAAGRLFVAVWPLEEAVVDEMQDVMLFEVV